MFKKNNLRKKFISFTLVMAMLICSLFTMSVAAQPNMYDYEFWSEMIKEMAIEFGVPVENIIIDFSSIREMPAEEVASLKGSYFVENAMSSSANSLDACPPHNYPNPSVNVEMIIYGGPYTAPGFCGLLANVKRWDCSNCSYYTWDFVSKLQDIPHRRPTGGACQNCGQ